MSLSRDIESCLNRATSRHHTMQQFNSVVIVNVFTPRKPRRLRLRVAGLKQLLRPPLNHRLTIELL
jgi:hypothetical protein